MSRTHFVNKCIFMLLILFGCFPLAKSETQETNIDHDRTKVIDATEILALNSTMRSMVDLFVKPIGNKQRRAEALYELMFATDKFGLRYEASSTKTAIETVESGSGDCVSLANAFVAMGRYAGLEVNYLDVKVPNNWQRQSNLIYKLTHVSASVKISSKDYLGIEYTWMGSIGAVKPRIRKDEGAFGSFYRNRGIELLMQNNLDAALKYLLRATDIDPDDSNNWSSLGLAYRRLDQLDNAEQAYLKAISIDKSDMTALNNLSILYQLLGNSKLSNKYEKKLERYRRKNPYYLSKLANIEIERKDYSKALKLIKKAIKKHKEEHEFHYVAAKIYAHLGDSRAAKSSLELAENYARESRNRDLYSRKLELLKDLENTKE